jgi:hypothetical protein
MTLVNVFRGQGAYTNICQRVERIGETGLEELLFCLPTNISGGANHEYDCEDAATGALGALAADSKLNLGV